jgi:hypothetical protein
MHKHTMLQIIKDVFELTFNEGWTADKIEYP